MRGVRARHVVLAALQHRLEELAVELSRPAPALYLFCAGRELLHAATALAVGGPARRSYISNSAAGSLSSCFSFPAVSSLAVPVSTTLDANCCLPRAAALSRCITGQHQGEAYRALAAVLQFSPSHRGVQLLLKHHPQQHHHAAHRHLHHHQHLHHHSFDDVRGALLFGRSRFALFRTEPSMEVWMMLFGALHEAEELPAERPHELLLPRRSGGVRAQPHWVARRVSLQ